MERTIKAVVRYDGTQYAGWQVQPGQRTVQSAIENALSTIANRDMRITGAGRTDSGVHALGQVFSCTVPTTLSDAKIGRALSKMLKPDIRIESVETVADDFHARYSAKRKRYAYTLCLQRESDPFAARYAWCVSDGLDISRLATLASAFAGEHDFAGYCCAGSSVESTVRTLFAVNVLEGGVLAPMDARGFWRIEFYGNGFLYKMVRNLVGSLVQVVTGREPESRLRERLNEPGPYNGYTAPAEGLFLVAVEY